MAPIEGERSDDEDWLGECEELVDRGGVETEDDGDDLPELATEEATEAMGITVELESEDVVTEVSATSKSIRSIVSCEFPLGMTEVSFSFLIIISWIPGVLKRIEYNTICAM